MFSSFRAKLIVVAVVVLGLALVACYFPIIPILERLSDWIGSLGLIGLAIFVVVLAVSSLFFFPASPVIIATAAVFGFALGIVGAVLGVGLGASLGFFLSRSFLRKDIAERLRRNPTFRAIDLAIEEDLGTWFIRSEIGHIDADGFITLTGRQSRFAKVGGDWFRHRCRGAGRRFRIQRRALHRDV